MEDAKTMELTEKIKLIRRKSLLSQDDFAKELGVAPSTVNRWETGKSCPNLATMKKLRDFCLRNDMPYETIEEIWLGVSKSEEE